MCGNVMWEISTFKHSTHCPFPKCRGRCITHASLPQYQSRVEKVVYTFCTFFLTILFPYQPQFSARYWSSHSYYGDIFAMNHINCEVGLQSPFKQQHYVTTNTHITLLLCILGKVVPNKEMQSLKEKLLPKTNAHLSKGAFSVTFRPVCMKLYSVCKHIPTCQPEDISQTG